MTITIATEIVGIIPTFEAFETMDEREAVQLAIANFIRKITIDGETIDGFYIHAICNIGATLKMSMNGEATDTVHFWVKS